MKQALIIYHLAYADFLERVRRYSFLLVSRACEQGDWIGFSRREQYRQHRILPSVIPGPDRHGLHWPGKANPKLTINQEKVTMNKIRLLANEHPLTFGLAITFVYILLVIVSTVLGALLPGENIYGQPGNILGRAISIALLLAALSSLGWLRSAGFTSSGGWRTWIILLLPLAYSMAVSVLAMTGNLGSSLSDLAPPGLVALFILIAAFLEEVIFRGLILHGFVRTWGSTNQGILKSVLFSSLLFASIHIFDFLSGRPLAEVFLQGVEAFFLGIFLAALVLRGKSIYPAVFFHAILNLTAYLTVTSKGLEPALSAWLLFSLVMIPIAATGIYILRAVPQQAMVPSAA